MRERLTDRNRPLRAHHQRALRHQVRFGYRQPADAACGDVVRRGGTRAGSAVSPGVDPWVREGITGKATTVADAPPTTLEDASLSTWIHPVDGSNNARSLDDVMRQLYQSTYKKGRGFTGADWWGAVSKAAGGRSFVDFNARYISGRQPFPFDQVLPLAGMRMISDTVRDPRWASPPPRTRAESSSMVSFLAAPRRPRVCALKALRCRSRFAAPLIRMG